MRLIGHLDNDKDARTFGDFLYVQEIETEFEREGSQWAIWVKADDHIATATKLRIDHELFGSLDRPYSASSTCSFSSGHIRGTAAVGVYAEAGGVWLPADGRALTGTVGVTVRLPASVGLVFGIPGC